MADAAASDRRPERATGRPSRLAHDLSGAFGSRKHAVEELVAEIRRHLVRLMAPGVLAFPLQVVSADNLRDDPLAGTRGRRWASIPA